MFIKKISKYILLYLNKFQVYFISLYYIYNLLLRVKHFMIHYFSYNLW